MTDAAARPPLLRTARLPLELDGARTVLAAVLALLAVMIVTRLPVEIVQDSWLALVGGREIVQHGLPHHDALTAWTHGARWIDQQWLGQLTLYGLWKAGGMRLVMLAHAALLVATIALGMRAARRLGAPAAAIALTAFGIVAMAPWALQMRTQVFGELFFVALVWLLAADSRRPSRRVVLAVPLLALWGNVHGSVALGAALVALRALALARTHRGRAALLLAGACAAPFASPYGFALAGYYRSLLLNADVHRYVDEWQPSGPSPWTATLYLFAALTIWAIGRYGREVGRFEQVMLLVTLVSALGAIRNITWFALCALVVLPGLLAPGMRGLDFTRFRRLTAPLALAAAAAVLATIGYAATRSQSWYVAQWPADRAGEVSALAAGGVVLADDRYADWLLWERPELRGRVAYDVRFELFDPSQFRELYAYRNRIGAGWRAPAERASVVALDPTLQPDVVEGLAAAGFRRAVDEPRLAVLTR